MVGLYIIYVYVIVWLSNIYLYIYYYKFKKNECFKVGLYWIVSDGK